MKITKAPIARTGLFMIICFAILVVFLFVIGDKQQMFSNTSKYYVKFKDVSGLKSGAQVQLSGINVGTVNDIQLPKQVGDSVVITLSLVKEVHDLLHSDSRAKVVTEGLVGNKAIALVGGSPTTPTLNPGGFIVGEGGFELGPIVDTVTSVVSTTQSLLTNINTLVSSINSGKGTLGSLLTKDDLYAELAKTIKTTNTLMESISGTVGTANASLKKVTDEAVRGAGAVNDILQKLTSGNGSISKLVNDSSLYTDLDQSLRNLSQSIYQVHDVMSKLSKSAGNAEELTEALKHNFLFKGYFEDAGYWDAHSYEERLDRKLDSLRKLEEKLQSQK